MKEIDEISGLDASRQKALTALLSTETVAAAARQSNLSEATLYRYLQDEAFKVAYQAARFEIVEHAITQLQRNCGTAARTLQEVCEERGAPAWARVSAARAILESSLKAVHIGYLAARVAELEKMLSLVVVKEQS